MTRYELLESLAERMKDELCIIGIGGMTDEWSDLRHAQPRANMYYPSLGGHTPMALGVAVGLPHRTVVSFDTDGGVLMNMGQLATLGNRQPRNLKVFVFDNGVYESVGGPPTATSGVVDLALIAQGAGIKQARTVTTVEEFREAAKEALRTEGLRYTVCKIQSVVKRDIDRKMTDGLEDKYNFVRHIEAIEGIRILRPRRPHWIQDSEDKDDFESDEG